MILNSAILLVAALFAGLLAVAAVARQPRTFGRWLFAAGMSTLAVETILNHLSLTAASAEQAVFWQVRRLWVMALLPGLWSSFSLCYSRGNHIEFIRQWWVWIAGSLVAPFLLAILYPDALVRALPVEDTSGVYLAGLGWAGRTLQVFALLSWVFVLLNFERTFRNTVGTMRWRIKFAIVGFGVLFGVRFYTSSQAFLFSAVARPQVTIEACAVVFACVFIVASVVRARTFEIDVYPSHAVLYNSLTILLAGLYLLVVGLLAKVTEAWGGAGSFPLAAALVLVALVGLGLLGLSDRVRLRLRRFVSLQFQRPLHDYRSLWSAFSERTATLVNPAELCPAVAKLVSETFEALSVSVWLVDESRGSLVWGASTTVSAQRASEVLADPSTSVAVLERLRKDDGPFDIEQLPESSEGGNALLRLQPDQFGKGGGRLAVPLRANGELLGLMTLGDRVSGLSFCGQDLDLLKCMADQTAASLLNLRLSQRLLEAKQMEAFQAMSAFFVHDLKNAASTLSLTLGNLRVHFDNPAFQQDALRALGRTADRINGLIERLALLRQELELRTATSDLNTVVREALQSLESSGPPVELSLGEIPSIRLDSAKMQRVVANFVLNAQEAVGKAGKIEVRTARRNGWVVLSVTDDGCGMTPEFVSRSLFRPFQTTKSRGLGIGMFQAKVIVEAHRGRIEVESAPGRGTTFSILLPVENSKP